MFDDEELVRDEAAYRLYPEDYMMILLRREGTVPFTWVSVTAYKQEQVRRHMPRYPMEPDQVEMLREALKMSAEISIALCALPILLAVSFSAWFWLLAGPMLLWPVIVGKLIWNTSLKGVPQWSLVPFKDYEGSLPFRIKTLVDYIYMVLPTADLRVDQLVQSDTVIDPFLVLRRSGVDHYIEVWDEDEFHG